MLQLGFENPVPKKTPLKDTNIKLGTDRELSCATNDSFEEYVEDNPHGGMPLAVSGLSNHEYSALTSWLNNGAKIDSREQTPSSDDIEKINEWEKWLNKPSPKHQLVSRYLYEHLFLGHLYLHSDKELTKRLQKDTESDIHFYRLVRSSTKPGKPIKEISTTRPNDKPPTDSFYYRLKPVTETIVYKSHIPYRFDKTRQRHFDEIFINKISSTELDLPGYSYTERANPFLTFSAIPAKSRYQFLLDNAEYFVRNFIRGPVCHGPIATDVIRDQFWVMFENPETDIFVNDESYRNEVAPYLSLPGENVKITEFGQEWSKYKDKRNHYLKLRQAYFANHPENLPEFKGIWKGNLDAFLTVFRHHDSASVTQGWQGDYPRTAWVLDYPLFERSYYELVVGFDVFANLSHQLQTRLYFDLIRNGGETNLLRFLPKDKRKAIYKDWYQGAAKLKISNSYQKIDTKMDTAIQFQTDHPKKEFFDYFFGKHPELTAAEDIINRCTKGCFENIDNNSKKARSLAHLRDIASRQADILPAVHYFPEITTLIVTEGTVNSLEQTYPFDDALNQHYGVKTPKAVYTLLRNRMHKNVAFMMGESLRYQKEQDTFTVLPKMIGSYPNLMLSVDEQHFNDFINQFISIQSEEDFNQLIQRYAVKRMDSQFWPALHSVRAYVKNQRPIEAGFLDISRYGYW